MTGGEVALELVRAAGLRPARVRADRVVIRCPLPGHDDRQPSAAVLAGGVLVCSVCGARDPYTWLVDAGLRPADAMELLVRLELRSDRRPELASRSGAPPPRLRSRSAAPPPGQPAKAASRRELAELSPAIGDRLAAAVAARRRLDYRLWELRALLPGVLDAAGVGLARADELARFSHAVRQAASERRLSLPLPDGRGRLVGALLVAPNPAKRAEPKVLALPDSSRVPLVLEPPAGVPMSAPLLVLEGELDALTAASCGLAVVGIPGIGAAVSHAERIAELVAGHGYRRALLIPDGDEPGRRGFELLASRLAELGVTVDLADVLEEGADAGTYLLAAAQAATGTRPKRCAIAGRALLALTTERRASMTRAPGSS